MDGDVATLISIKETLQTKQDNAVADLQKALLAKEEHVEAYHAKIEDLQKKWDAAQADLTDERRAKEALDCKYADLQQVNDGYLRQSRETFEKLESRMADYDVATKLSLSRVADLQDEIKDYKRAIEELREREKLERVREEKNVSNMKCLIERVDKQEGEAVQLRKDRDRLEARLEGMAMQAAVRSQASAATNPKRLEPGNDIGHERRVKPRLTMKDLMSR